MDTISRLKTIATEHELEGLDNILLQLEIMKNIQSPEIQKTLDKILELAQIEPSVLTHFIEGFQKTAAAFNSGSYHAADADTLSKFIDEQADQLKKL